MKNWAINVSKAVMVTAALCGGAISSLAQACPLCINNVAASKPEFISGLRHGILILLFPPLAICLSIGMMTYRRRNHYNDQSGEEQL